ncbi:MAG TPA: ATP-binding protein [Syntrophomonadaceae bacterium]|nr:ATP-binding protein [Syntrophomonadaceae bacterium]
MHQFEVVVISTDDIRRDVFGVQFDPELEPAVWKLAYERLEAALQAEKVVCFDATNTTIERRKPLIERAKKYNAAVEAVVFLQDPAVLLKRNAERPPGKKVPEEVIWEKVQDMEIPSFQEGFDRILIYR